MIDATFSIDGRRVAVEELTIRIVRHPIKFMHSNSSGVSLDNYTRTLHFIVSDDAILPKPWPPAGPFRFMLETNQFSLSGQVVSWEAEERFGAYMVFKCEFEPIEEVRTFGTVLTNMKNERSST